MSRVRVLLADDHALVRAGLRALLAEMRDVEVVAEAADGREALSLVEKHRPHVVLMDITMPELSGLEAAARVAEACPHTRVLILSMHASEEYVLQALRAGVAGYLVKDASVAELELAIRAVAAGGTYLSPTLSRFVVEDYLRRVGGEASPLERLTPRQREVLQLVAEGHSTKEVAWKLGLSVKTVETHRKEIMERLGIRDVAGLVRFAVRVGLVSPET